MNAGVDDLAKMAQVKVPSNHDKLIHLVERYNLFYVKTLHYNDLRGVLDWLGLQCGDLAFSQHEDTVTVLNRLLPSLHDVAVVSIDMEPQIEGKTRVIVYIKRDHGHGQAQARYDSIVLFLVVNFDGAPYNQDASIIFKHARALLTERKTPLFPEFAKCRHGNPSTVVVRQEQYPILDGFLALSYDTTKPKTPNVPVDSFGRIYKPLRSTKEASPWSLYADIPGDHECAIDIETLITTKDTVLGRGGFGVTVLLNKDLVAKTNLFPDLVNWSRPEIDSEFNRYAHIASQVEEVMMGVSMKHANILRTFGGLWCDIPGYQLGGRAVLIMERALCSLHEFMWNIGNVSIVPMVELDTLRALDYLRSRAIQHRDITHRNILVCHQTERTPAPFAFKISDFGTACNFSTPDQPRGNRCNMAPEVMWCLNAATGSDVFSWYCVMWELYNGSPLIPHKSGNERGFCKKTYAENLSKLVGVYNAENNLSFELGYMKAMDARVLHAKYKDSRPSVEQIRANLTHMARNNNDKAFIQIGALCITLFPQERQSPSELLNLKRYKCLSRDISEANVPHRALPLSIHSGEYRLTDFIVSDDCAPEGLAKLMTDAAAAKRPLTRITSKVKRYYGVDLLRLAPGRIQPYQWYSNKVKELADVYQINNKRKAADTEIPIQARRLKVTSVDPGEGTSTAGPVRQEREEELLPTRAREHPLGDTAGDSSHNCVRSNEPVQMLSSSVLGDDALNGDNVSARSMSLNNRAVESPGEVILQVKQIPGELATHMAILKSHNGKEIKRFKDNVILLSQSMTQTFPLMFAGPRDGLSKCSRCNGVFIFQYAQFFEGCKQVSSLDTSDASTSAHGLLLQVFLMLKAALEWKLLPTHMTQCNDILISRGAVMIDIVSYLSRNFNKPRSSMFGEHCEGLLRLCVIMVTKHLPHSELCKQLREMNPETPASCILATAIEHLTRFGSSERTTPSISTLDGNFFTFKDYTSDIPNWLTAVGEEEDAHDRSCTKVLVYGRPKPCKRDLIAEGLCAAKLKTLVRDIVLRMKVKIFGLARLEVTTLDCTQGFAKVTLKNSALCKIPCVDQLDRSRLLHADGKNYFTHDAILPLSKWAPVIMFTKCKQYGPTPECTFEYYSVKILMVLLGPEGTVASLGDLFQSMSSFSVTHY
ncbi:uncharacterized protein LOC118494538 [Sander lucioperca]|uniref:uncharacterized protein LOC118494538 n=1 Tax=Sander lucioperca TaxID=283035 RepID=UPI0016537FD5|nr:uncharacterized protein LOC118494538 [Sander lucioperca]